MTQANIFFSVEDQVLARVDELLKNAPGVRPFPMAAEYRPMLHELRWHQGKERAIQVEDLTRKLGTNRRKLLDGISELRRTYGVKIGSSRSGEHRGFFLIRTQAELDDTVAMMKAEVFTQLRTISQMESRAFVAGMLGQMQVAFEKEVL